MSRTRQRSGCAPGCFPDVLPEAFLGCFRGVRWRRSFDCFSMSAPSRDNAGVIIFPPLLFAICVALGGALHFVWPVRVLAPLPARITGAVLIGVAGGFALWAVRTMKCAGTNVRPDEPTLAIVSSGPYRLSRNPMYVSLCLVHVGIALVIDGLAPLLFVVPLALTLHFGVIKREERYLAAKFGGPYLAYQHRVRRWL